VAEALVRRSACPVLVDRPAAAQGTIVVGVTGATGTAALLAWTAAEAARRGSALLVLHGWSRPAVEPAAVDEAERALCRGYLEPLQARFPDLTVDVRVERGRPEDYLVRAAAEAELLVVGRRPQAERLSTAGRVAAAAATPVLVVPLGSAAPAARRDLLDSGLIGTKGRTGTR
jgi:nucleotide-binding universal stress UspA family protein